jgi:hypothetical protein
VNRNLVSQVLELFRCGGAAQHLIAVRVASEARYDLAVSLGLIEIVLVPPSEVQRSVGNFLLAVADGSLQWA